MAKIEKAHRSKAGKTQWVIEGNRTVIPQSSQPSTFAVNMADRRVDRLSEDGVPHPSEEDVIEARVFVDQNHK